MMGEIMEKRDWETKVLDGTIVGKWRSEAVREDNNFSELMFKFVSHAATYLHEKILISGDSASMNSVTMPRCNTP